MKWVAKDSDGTVCEFSHKPIIEGMSRDDIWICSDNRHRARICEPEYALYYDKLKPGECMKIEDYNKLKGEQK